MKHVERRTDSIDDNFETRERGIMKKESKAGFTLIELLVVISIISLLLAILMPALGEVRRKAKGLICLTRLRNLGQLAQIYVNQNDYQFWSGGGWSNSPPLYGDKMWWSVLGKLSDPGSKADARYSFTDRRNNYVDNWRMRCCPMAEIPVGRDIQHPKDPYKGWGPFPVYDDRYKSWEEDGIYGSFGANSWVNKVPQGATFGGVVGQGPYAVDKFWQVTLVKNTDKIPVLMDCAWHEAYPDTNNIPPIGERDVWYTNSHGFTYPEEMKLVCLNRHNQFTQMVFMDGSARKVALKQLWYQKWNRRSYLDGRGEPLYNTVPNGAWMARFRKTSE